MKHRFLLHALSHTFVVVDITKIDSGTVSNTTTGQEQFMPAFRFRSWKDAERYFLAMGGDATMVESTAAQLRKAGVAVLTIV
jgi:hypothetical protein